jgi:hypothetical protein
VTAAPVNEIPAGNKESIDVPVWEAAKFKVA